MAIQITGLSIVRSPVGSATDQRKYQSSTLLVFVQGIHRWPVISPHKRPVTRKMFPFQDVFIGRLQMCENCSTNIRAVIGEDEAQRIKTQSDLRSSHNESKYQNWS